MHCDVQGPIQNPCSSGARYFLPLLGDAFVLSVVCLIQSKKGYTTVLEDMIANMETATGRTVKELGSDSALELLSKDFQSWLRVKGIAHETSPSYFAESNGKAERLRQTLLSTTRCLSQMVSIVPWNKKLWDDAVMTANYLTNRMYSASGNMKEKTSYEAFTGMKPNLSIFVFLDQKHMFKFQNKSELPNYLLARTQNY